MKITIESTIKDSYSSKATIETEHDDVNMKEMAEMLYKACIAYGFHPNTVEQYILTEYELSESPKE